MEKEVSLVRGAWRVRDARPCAGHKFVLFGVVKSRQSGYGERILLASSQRRYFCPRAVSRAINRPCVGVHVSGR